MAVKLSRRAKARQALQIAAHIERAICDLTSTDEYVRAEAVRQLCPCRAQRRWTLERYVVPMGLTRSDGHS